VEHEGFLTTIAEVGIAVAGFSGIVAVLGRRSEGDWSEADRLRLRLLLLVSFNTVLLSLLPMFLSAAGVVEEVWRAASGICLVYLLGIALYRVPQIARAREQSPREETSPLFLGLMVGLFATVLVLQGVNVVRWETAWPYFLVLLQGLALAFILFVRLLRVIWAPEQRAA
jgi:hypothetical protein